MKPAALLLLLAAPAVSQTQPPQVAERMAPDLQTPDVVAFQLRNYLIKKAPAPPQATSAEQWAAEARRLRRRVLDEVIFHGWPRAWVEAPPRFEDLGEIPAGQGYRMRKLRYEIVPGFHSTAILYEPAVVRGKVPAVLNVNGHVGRLGKAVEYKQKRCIHQALQGMLALNLEWLNQGELTAKESEHWFGAHLELAGAHAVGLFYLAMRKGLDYLAQHPSVDVSRIGVSGLSGGGWQTIVLSGLDERVAVSVPVAGYSAVSSRIQVAHTNDIGDTEQNPTDMLPVADYSHLTAMRAPRPTLLINNAEDNCCFRAPLIKPGIFDVVRPIFRLFGKEENLAWHENTDPSDHNYQRDNRLQSYRFFARHFGLPVPDSETPVDAEVKSYEELVVGLPKDNLTILGLARRLAAGIERPAAGRAELAETLRYRPVKLARVWSLYNTKRKELETRSYRFELDNGLSATGVWLKAIAAADDAPVTVVLSDQGKKNAQEVISERVNRGERVLAVDLLFTGDAAPQKPGPYFYTHTLSALGERALGLEGAQLVAVAGWPGRRPVRLEASGIRSQVTALAAAALEPGLFSEIVVREGMRSLRHLLDAPVAYEAAPDLFCLDLYKRFDVDRLVELAAPARVAWK